MRNDHALSQTDVISEIERFLMFRMEITDWDNSY